LRQLNINSNILIESLAPSVFQNLTRLKLLGLAFNLLTNLNTQNTSTLFANLTCLTFLDLTSNQLTSHDLTADLFSNQILFLFLSGNQLGPTLPRLVFTQMSHVQFLFLSFNQLIFLDNDVFEGMSNLSVLDLSYNYLSSLNASLFRNLTELNILDLKYNRILNLDHGVFRLINSKFFDVQLYGNKILSNFSYRALQNMFCYNSVLNRAFCFVDTFNSISVFYEFYESLYELIFSK
jgi:Leucine-rich repeat (LRR) protein